MNQGDWAHPISYDVSFGNKLVLRARAEGCLFLRKVKRPLDLNVQEGIVLWCMRGHDVGAVWSTGLDITWGGQDCGGRRGGGKDGTGTDMTIPPVRGISCTILGQIMIRGGAMIQMDGRVIARDGRESLSIITIAMISKTAALAMVDKCQ
jgi:hypothetical protein